MNYTKILTHTVSILGGWIFFIMINIYLLHWNWSVLIIFGLIIELIFYGWRNLMQIGKWIALLVIPGIIFSYFGPTIGTILAVGWFLLGALIVSTKYLERSRKQDFEAMQRMVH